MGTQQIPDLTADRLPKGSSIVDVPRIGWLMWVVLLCLLIPPAVVTLVGSRLEPIPHQTLWVVLLGCPFPAMFLILPKQYVLDDRQLTIAGFFYRVRIPREDILSVSRVHSLKALFHPRSIFCSDPSNAFLLTCKNGRGWIISPRRCEPFLNLGNHGQDKKSP
jgi:hypothetical protein